VKLFGYLSKLPLHGPSSGSSAYIK
jgi:hypothetical protein